MTYFDNLKGVDAPQAGIFVTVDHGPLPLECIESSHYLAPTPTGPWTLTEVVKVYLQGYLPDKGAANIYDGTFKKNTRP